MYIAPPMHEKLASLVTSLMHSFKRALKRRRKVAKPRKKTGARVSEAARLLRRQQKKRMARKSAVSGGAKVIPFKRAG